MHCLQSFPPKVSGFAIGNVFSCYEILIYVTAVMPELYQFLKSLNNKLSQQRLYVASIKAIRLRLLALQSNNVKNKEISLKDLPKDPKDAEDVLQHYGRLYIQYIIEIKLISRHQNDPFTGHFDINIICKPIA